MVEVVVVVMVVVVRLLRLVAQGAVQGGRLVCLQHKNSEVESILSNLWLQFYVYVL